MVPFVPLVRLHPSDRRSGDYGRPMKQIASEWPPVDVPALWPERSTETAFPSSPDTRWGIAMTSCSTPSHWSGRLWSPWWMKLPSFAQSASSWGNTWGNLPHEFGDLM